MLGHGYHKRTVYIFKCKMLLSNEIPRKKIVPVPLESLDDEEDGRNMQLNL